MSVSSIQPGTGLRALERPTGLAAATARFNLPDYLALRRSWRNLLLRWNDSPLFQRGAPEHNAVRVVGAVEEAAARPPDVSTGLPRLGPPSRIDLGFQDAVVLEIEGGGSIVVQQSRLGQGS